MKKTYGQFCPVAMALEILAERWTLLVVRELLCGSRRFNDLSRGLPQMSRTMLSQRLKTLEEAGVVVRVPAPSGGGHEYALTTAGQELRPIVMWLGEWGQRWASADLQEEHLDSSLLMWDIHRRIDHDAVPEGRIVLRFEFPDAHAGQRYYWLRLEGGEADVCFTNPGFDVQLEVQCGVRVLTDIWMGKTRLGDAVRTGELRLEGDRSLAKLFPRWLQLSMFASVKKTTAAERRAPTS
jgi:DNA-binding HxlR family transcriptional regulator